MFILFKAVLVMVIVLTIWLIVQRLWVRTMGSQCADPLAGRMGCNHCDCPKRVDQEKTDTRTS